MKKITIAGDFPFTDEQKARLEALGEVRVASGYSSSEGWLQSVENSDVILSDGDYLLENLDKLKNVFVTYPFIEIGAFDSEKLKASNVLVANTRGSNKSSIVQWVTFMTLSLFRKFPTFLNTHEQHDFELAQSLKDKKVLIVGKGDIGTGIGEVLEALKMKVEYFQRGDDLKARAADADLVVNALSTNSSSKNLLDEAFFMSLKSGSYFVSFVRKHTYDLGGLIKSLDAGILAGAAIDCDPEEPFDIANDFYQTCLKHEKILVTPHIAFATKEASARGREVAIQNIEAYLSGKPQNILTKA